MEIKKKLVQNTSVNYLSTFINIAVGFVLFPFILHTIGNELYGVYLLIMALSGYLSLMEIGVGTTTVKYISQHLAKGEQKEINELLVNSLLFYTFVGIIIGAFLIICAFFFINFFNISAKYLILAKKTLILAGFVSFVVWPLSLFRKVIEGKQDYVVTSGLTAVFALARFLVIFLFLKQGGYGLLFLTIVYFVSQILLNLIFVIYSFRSLDFLKIDFSLFSKRVYKKIFGFSWVLFVIQICGMLIYQTDKIIIGLFLPVGSIALYEGAFRVHQAIRTINALASSAAIPAVSSLNAKGAIEKVNELFLRGSKYATIIVLPLTVIIILFAKYIITYWLGHEYNSVVFPMQLFVSYWALNCSFALSGTVLIATNKIKYLLWYSVGGAIGNLILSLILVNYMHNFVGVIWGTIIPYFIGYPIFLFFFLRLMNIKFNEFFKKIILSVYSYLVVPITIGIVALQIRPPANLVETMLYMGGLLLSYWAVTFFRGLENHEREDIKGIVLSTLRARGSVSK